MWPTSQAYKDALVQSHDAYSSADLYLAGVRVATDLPVIGGSVSVDGSADVRRSCNLQLVDESGALNPSSAAGALLSPYGVEVSVQRGLTLPVASVEAPPLGRFRVSVASVTDEGSRVVSITGYDRARSIARNVFADPYVVAAGQSYLSAISALASNRLPGVTVSILLPSTQLTPLLVLDVGANPWTELTNMCSAIGAICYFNPAGTFVVAPAPDVVDDPVVWTYAEGPLATVLSVEKNLSDDPGYNGVVLSGESTTLAVPVRTTVWDANPSSPTYYLGPYGKVPLVATSPYVANQGQCDAQAALLLAQNIGVTEQVVLTAIPNPAHEAGDSVRVTRGESGVDHIGLLEQFQVPLGASEGMSMTLRRRQAVTP